MAVDGRRRSRCVTPGPFGAGTIWRETRALADGEPVTEEFRVTECEPASRFVVCSPGIGADYRMTYTLAPVRVGRHRGGTMVTVVQEGARQRPDRPACSRWCSAGWPPVTVEGALRQELTDLRWSR